MKFDLKKPCKDCPFRNDIHPFLSRERAEEIASSLERHTFPCHKTVDYSHDDDEGAGRVHSNSQHCAGAMIMLEKMEAPSQMMRIAERLGVYDYRKLDMNAPVFEDAEEFIEAQEY